MDKYLSRDEAAKFLEERGLKVSKNTLQKLATVGGGPSFQKFGGRVVYTEPDLLAWIQSRLSKPRANTSSGGAK